MKEIADLLKDLVPVWLLLMTIAYVYLLVMFYKLMNKTNELADKQSQYLKDRVEIIEKTTGIYEKTFLQQEKSIQQLDEENRLLKNRLNESLKKLDQAIQLSAELDRKSKTDPAVDQNLDLIARLKGLSNIYSQVKSILLLADLQSDKVIISSIFEIRNTFDHLMKALDPNVDINEHLHEAREHLIRAGFDSAEILIAQKITSITLLVKEVGLEVINEVYPQYYTEIRPVLQTIQDTLRAGRARELRISTEEQISLYQDYIARLFNIEEEIITTKKNKLR